MTAYQVCTAFNAAYAPFGATLVASLAASRASTSALTVTILHTEDVSPAIRTQIEDLAHGLRLRWHLVRPEQGERHGVRLEGLLGDPAYFRCLVPDVIDPSANRAVYLDADTLVLQDLAQLASIPLFGAPVGAVADWLPTIADGIAPWRKLGLDASAPYFNSGVLVIDLEAWEQEGAGGAALRRCLRDRRHLVAHGKWPQNDQYGLNVVFHKRWRRISSRWNHFSELPSTDAAVIHFVGNGKPWAEKCRPELAELWRRRLDVTPWAGWRDDSRRFCSHP